VTKTLALGNKTKEKNVPAVGYLQKTTVCLSRHPRISQKSGMNCNRVGSKGKSGCDN